MVVGEGIEEVSEVGESGGVGKEVVEAGGEVAVAGGVPGFGCAFAVEGLVFHAEEEAVGLEGLEGGDEVSEAVVEFGGEFCVAGMEEGEVFGGYGGTCQVFQEDFEGGDFVVGEGWWFGGAEFLEFRLRDTGSCGELGVGDGAGTEGLRGGDGGCFAGAVGAEELVEGGEGFGVGHTRGVLEEVDGEWGASGGMQEERAFAEGGAEAVPAVPEGGGV